MSTARFKDHFAKGLLSARPGADTLQAGAKYAASDTGLIYETDGVSTWSTWFNPGPGTDPEIIRDIIGAALVAGSGITVTVNDSGDTITIASTVSVYTDEQARDAIGAALVAGTGMTITVNDAGDTITLASSGGYTDEQARDAVGAALVAGTGMTITVNDAGDTITLASSGGGGGGGGSSAFMGARVYNSANISVANGSTSGLTFDSERYDTDSIHSTVTNTSRLTAPVAGKYRVGASMYFANNTTGARGAQLRVNGTTAIAESRIPTVVGTDVTGVNVSAEVDLAAGDYVEVIAYQTSGGALNVLAIGNSSPEFWMSKIDSGGGGNGGGSVIATNAYNPGTIAAYSTTSTTDADADATNMAVTFVAPSSGNVLIRLSALASPPPGTGGYWVYTWSLRESSSVVMQKAVYGANSSPTNDIPISTEFLITGLTPGTTHTYKWGHHISGGATAGSIYAGGVAGQAVMEVVSLDTPGSGSAPLTGDTAPSVANADDYEFNGSASALPSGWSWVNQSTSTYVEGKGSGVLAIAAGGADEFRGIVRAIPAGSAWTASLKARMSAVGVASKYPAKALVLRESGSGKFVAFQVIYTPNNDTDKTYVSYGLDKYTNLTTFSARYSSAQLMGSFEFPYLRIVKNSPTSYDFQVSADGVAWTTCASGIDVSAFCTPDQIGFMVNQRTLAPAASIDWYRVG